MGLTGVISAEETVSIWGDGGAAGAAMTGGTISNRGLVGALIRGEELNWKGIDW